MAYEKKQNKTKTPSCKTLILCTTVERVCSFFLQIVEKETDPGNIHSVNG